MPWELLEDDRLQVFLVAPPCTTFSPAAHPACRSYKKPRGFNPQLPKVHIGNLLAFASLALMLVALRMRKFGLCETTRRSKMRWLNEWRRLLLLGCQRSLLSLLRLWVCAPERVWDDGSEHEG